MYDEVVVEVKEDPEAEIGGRENLAKWEDFGTFMECLGFSEPDEKETLLRCFGEEEILLLLWDNGGDNGDDIDVGDDCNIWEVFFCEDWETLECFCWDWDWAWAWAWAWDWIWGWIWSWSWDCDWDCDWDIEEEEDKVVCVWNKDGLLGVVRFKKELETEAPKRFVSEAKWTSDVCLVICFGEVANEGEDDGSLSGETVIEIGEEELSLETVEVEVKVEVIGFKVSLGMGVIWLNCLDWEKMIGWGADWVISSMEISFSISLLGIEKLRRISLEDSRWSIFERCGNDISEEESVGVEGLEGLEVMEGMDGMEGDFL